MLSSVIHILICGLTINERCNHSSDAQFLSNYNVTPKKNQASTEYDSVHGLRVTGMKPSALEADQFVGFIFPGKE